MDIRQDDIEKCFSKVDTSGYHWHTEQNIKTLYRWQSVKEKMRVRKFLYLIVHGELPSNYGVQVGCGDASCVHPGHAIAIMNGSRLYYAGKEPRHGTAVRYVVYGCRCDKCQRAADTAHRSTHHYTQYLIDNGTREKIAKRLELIKARKRKVEY